MTSTANAVRCPDTQPLQPERTVVLSLHQGGKLRIDVLAPQLFRIRQSADDTWSESALNRYGVMRDASFPDTPFHLEQNDAKAHVCTVAARLDINLADGRLALQRAGETLASMPTAPDASRGCHLEWALADDERIYGLGDSSRESIMRRGDIYEIWVLNVKSYIPIPLMFSSRGWGFLLNSTWRSTFDVGKTSPDRIVCDAPCSETDYYLFAGEGLPDLLDIYTQLAGRPAVLPVWAYSLAYVCHQDADAFRMMDEAAEMRKSDIPCDILGLEPGWMSTRYDYSTKKKWHPEKFYLPPWAPQGNSTFLGALQRLGYKLSLWLCCDYDLSFAEEQALPEATPLQPRCIDQAEDNSERDRKFRVGYRPQPLEAFEQDEHLDGFKKEAAADPQCTAEDAAEPWFEHLKKFVDQGACCFKLDGANQVNVHPQRHWGNGMHDLQMHNLYPMLWGKQMARGFEQHTGRRSMIYSAAGFTGVQQFVASWAGDTGGGPKPLASMLNLGLSGHSNHSCDMEVFSNAGIHFGFLQTWAQLNNWCYWRQPWYLTPEGQEVFRFYAQLRNILLPYLYSSAHQAAACGLPVMRAMPLAFPEEISGIYDRTQYMLGDAFLVTAYTDQLRLPAGRWLDFWTRKRVQGPLSTTASYPENRGGCLFLKTGAIVPLWPKQHHIDRGFNQRLKLLVFPDADLPSSFTLYEDDGITLDYLQGKLATTLIQCLPGDNGSVTIIVQPRRGEFTGMNTKRECLEISAYLDAKPAECRLNGIPLNDDLWRWDDTNGCASVALPHDDLQQAIAVQFS